MQYPWVSDVSEDNRDFLIEGGSCELESFVRKAFEITTACAPFSKTFLS